jgi:hypothetical protein
VEGSSTEKRPTSVGTDYSHLPTQSDPSRTISGWRLAGVPSFYRRVPATGCGERPRCNCQQSRCEQRSLAAQAVALAYGATYYTEAVVSCQPGRAACARMGDANRPTAGAPVSGRQRMCTESLCRNRPTAQAWARQRPWLDRRPTGAIICAGSLRGTAPGLGAGSEWAQ